MLPYLTLSWSVEGPHDLALLGESAASACDVNGDGYGDVVTGGSGFMNGQLAEGGAFVYLGSVIGLDPTPVWSAESDQDFAFLGTTAASAGDVDGDGFDDIVIGAPGYTDSEDSEGRVYVFHGSAIGPEIVPGWTVDSNVADARWGAGVASAGDVNGDGYDDLLIAGAPNTGGTVGTGVASLYLGSATGLDAQPSWSVEFDHDSEDLTASIASAGDVNGDGFDDVVVGAPLYENGEQEEGGAWVYLGSSTGLDVAHVWSAESDESDSEFGWSVASAGDLNADGYADVVVGAYRQQDTLDDEGFAFVFLGSASGPEPAPTWSEDSDDRDAWYGFVVAPAGDVNDDGFDDLVVGAPAYDDQGAFAQGKVYVYHGVATYDTDLDGVYDHLDRCSGDDASGDQDLDGWCALGVDGFAMDCLDTDATVYPGALEVCDGLDTPCVGYLPADETDVDADSVSTCEGDCDDDDPTSFPGAVEICDGVDNGCSGTLPADELDEDGDGVLVCGDDCDDGDPTTWPGAPALCDGIVNACVGDLSIGESDNDGDGVMSCDGDCNDADVWANPTLDEVCDDDIDNNCDGTADEGCDEEEEPPPPVEQDEPPDEEIQTGCGCAVSPSNGGLPVLLAAVLLAARASRGPRCARKSTAPHSSRHGERKSTPPGAFSRHVPVSGVEAPTSAS